MRRLAFLFSILLFFLTGCSDYLEEDYSQSENISNSSKSETQPKASEQKKIEYKYPITYKMKEFLMSNGEDKSLIDRYLLENEEYLSEIIDLANHPYCLSSVEKSARENDEFMYKVNEALDNYSDFLNSRIDVGKVLSDNCLHIRELYAVMNYETEMAINPISDASNNPTSQWAQLTLVDFISGLKMTNFFEEAGNRSVLLGYNLLDVYFFEEFMSGNFELFNRIEGISYLTEEDLLHIKEEHKIYADKIEYFINAKAADNQKCIPELRNLTEDIHSYLNLCKSLIDTLYESKSVIGEETRYYIEDNQKNIYNDMLNKYTYILQNIENM